MVVVFTSEEQIAAPLKTLREQKRMIPSSLSIPNKSTFDAREFRKCLSQFSTGVTIVTAEHDGSRVGVTANSFSSLSIDPPLVLWSLSRTSRTFATFSNAPSFIVNILAWDQVAISQRFSSMESDKFAGVEIEAGQNGAPILAGCAANIECTTEFLHDGGDHLLIIGRVSRFLRTDRDVLVFSKGRYCVAVDHPVLREGDDEQKNSHYGTKSAEKPSLSNIIFKAQLCSARGFDEHRAALGYTINQGRIFSILSEHPAPLCDLVRNSNMPKQAVDDAVTELLDRGDIEHAADGMLALTEAGEARRRIIRARFLTYEADSLSRIPSADVEVTRKTLLKFVEQHAYLL